MGCIWGSFGASQNHYRAALYHPKKVMATQEVADNHKKASVMPVSKKGMKKDLMNYRPELQLASGPRTVMKLISLETISR